MVVLVIPERSRGNDPRVAGPAIIPAKPREVGEAVSDER